MVLISLDINECESNPCGKGEKCQNLNGKYHCIKLIICSRGYEINEAGDSCVGKKKVEIRNAIKIHFQFVHP